MNLKILHESTGRMRVHLDVFRLVPADADVAEYALRDLPFVTHVTVSDRTADAVIEYVPGNRHALVTALSELDLSDEKTRALVPEHTGRALHDEYTEKMTFTVLRKIFRQIFFPAPLRAALTLIHAIPYFVKAIRSLLHGRIEVSVLDAAAIGVSMARGDFSSAGNIIFLQHIGDLLEEWTHQKSVDDLADMMSLKVGKVWVRTGSGEEVLVSVNDVAPGDTCIVRKSNVIPLDGIVLSGEGTVNQSSMTGESVPVPKKEGAALFAGTVVEEGELVYRVTRSKGSGRYDQIVQMIEESEKLKSGTETRAFHLADNLVPWAFVGVAVTYLLTRNVTRALSFLMVDFSCALKLSMPLSVMSAMRDAGEHDISVKGGKYLEAIADADTIVFDKTGTLTHATPRVHEVIPFSGTDAAEDLRIAACLEEHFPHSIANAVVAEAKRRGLTHDEMHTKVEYIVAHGIATQIDGKRAVIGSHHFVFEDEKVTVPAEDAERFDAIPAMYSPLYLAVDGMLTAVILIEDPIREEAPEVLDELHRLGITKICMMTGDNKRTAAGVAEALHIDEYHAEVLPEDKAAFIRNEHKAGRKVIMVGDGVNDTPALSEADVGLAVSEGAAIAQEVADIVITGGTLHDLVLTRRIAQALMGRIRSNYRFIMTWNGMLIALGAFGVISPQTASWFHNVSTLLIGMHSMTKVLPDDRE